ncbi:MAG: alternative ribosome rescue aminoacyl-tRNA hydrolase ArfB [Phycisphaerae bacterium]
MAGETIARFAERLRNAIGEQHFSFSFTRSSGPGGQNVNKVATRATLLFDITACESLSAAQKQRLFERLPGRINRQGVMRVVCFKHRTQGANRRTAIDRFYILLAQALTVAAPRKTKPVPLGAKMRRRADKRKRGEIKRLRGKSIPNDSLE